MPAQPPDADDLPLVDHAPGAGGDAAEGADPIGGGEGEGQGSDTTCFSDVASPSVDDPGPEEQAQAPRPRAPRASPAEAILPERRVARPPKPERSRAGFAICPACDATNEPQVRACLRCGAAIAPPAPEGLARDVGPLGRRVAREQSAPMDLDLLPPEVRARFLADAERRAARGGHLLLREAALRRRAGWVVGVLLALAGGFLLGILPRWLVHVAFVADLAIGVVAGRWLWDSRAGSMRGLVVLSALYAASAGVKLCVGLATTDFERVAAHFPEFMVGLLLAMFSGRILGLKIEQGDFGAPEPPDLGDGGSA